MKKQFILLFAIILIQACSKPNPAQQLKNLNGYWEIEKVVTLYNKEVNYNFNATIDYIELKDSIGFRTKVTPQLDGTFIENNNDPEVIKPQFLNDSLYLYYSTPFDNWIETVLVADGEKLVVKNQNNLIYTYKKYKPINSTP